jgi:hypothetical protein
VTRRRKEKLSHAEHTRRLWLRIQEEPLELSVAFITVVACIFTLTERYDNASMFALLYYLALLPGGLAAIAGRLRDNLAVESAGLALLIGGYAFATLRSLGHAPDVVTAFAVIIDGGALTVGFVIRLIVVRKAARARLMAARGLFRR